MRSAAAALVAAGLVGAPVRATLTAPTHTPKVNTRWYYVVTATQGGKPLKGRLTVQIVDPIGGAHPVTYGTTTKKLVNWPFNGRFGDFVLWPGSSRGVPLKLRATIVGGGAKTTLTYAVTARK